MHQPADAHRVPRAFVSVMRLWKRRGRFAARDWIMDSGAFSQVVDHGDFVMSPRGYAYEVRRWAKIPGFRCAVAQDYPCEQWTLDKWGRTVEQHQRMTVDRYDALMAESLPCYLMPCLQGQAPDDYVRHVGMYGDRLPSGAWIGVGSVCKRNGNPGEVRDVLAAIKDCRPDLRLHGFGLKLTSLADASVRDLLTTADSMAWSFAARRNGGDRNGWREALAFAERVDSLMHPQGHAA